MATKIPWSQFGFQTAEQVTESGWSSIQVTTFTMVDVDLQHLHFPVFWKPEVYRKTYHIVM